MFLPSGVTLSASTEAPSSEKSTGATWQVAPLAQSKMILNPFDAGAVDGRAAF